MKPIHASLIGLIQGLLLLGLHKAIQWEWPVISDPSFWMPAYALILLPPIVAILTAQHGAFKERLKIILGISLLLFITACYTGYQINFDEGNSWGGLAFTFAAVMAIASFIFLSFSQNWLTKNSLTNYNLLYENGWKNALTVAIAVVFTGLAWLLLMLWAALFDLLKIHLFHELFHDENFIYCATGAIVGYGIALGQRRSSTGMIEHIDYLFRTLLIVVSFITVLFIIALPLSGLQPLWDTKSATSLLITLQLVFIVFYNAIYQRGYIERQEEHPALKKLIETAALLLPLLSAISIYAVWLRVDQYGWSFTRVIVALIVSVIAIYAIGYAAAVLHKGKTWMLWVEPTNITAAAVLMLMAILVHTPLLDPKIIAASSQSARILAQHLMDKSDYNYLRFSLGKPGIRALQELTKSDKPDIATLAQTTLEKTHRYKARKTIKDSDIHALTLMDMDHYFYISPKGTALPESFKKYIFQSRTHEPWRACFIQDNIIECNLFISDFNGNSRHDIVIIPTLGNIILYAENNENRWERIAEGSFIYNSNLFNNTRASLQLATKAHPLADLLIDGKIYNLKEKQHLQAIE
ncbi:MAG: DUF4153 domain-containing protein [Mariprofundaceae bacterium]|nr:DUF4153 domain-containing protein [Mariprofundaceae bacterium]